MHKTLAEFFAMGGYAGYVWASYAAWFVVIGLNVYYAVRGHGDAVRHARRRLAMRGPAAAEVEE